MTLRGVHRVLPTLACVSLVVGAACRIGGSSTLLEDSNVQLLVSGLAPGERIRITIGDEARETIGGETEPLVVYMQLDAGAYRGALEAGDVEGDARCGTFSVAIDDDEDVDVIAIDAASLASCASEGEGELPDAGSELPDAGDVPDAGIEELPDAGSLVDTFVLLEETVNDAVCVPPCSVVTSVRSNGTVTVIDHGGAPRVGTLPDADLDAIALAAVGLETDALFTGLDALCPQVSLLGLVTLRRELDAEGGAGTDVDTADVSVCLEGTAAQLRARLDLARTFLP